MANRKELTALITLAGKIDPSLSAALREASGQTKKTSKEVEKLQTFANKAGNALKIGVAAGAVATVAAITVLASKSLEAADNLMKMSDKTGIGVEELQKLQYISNQTGASFEGIEKATSILTKNMASARAGSKETAAAFKVLGVEVKDAATGKLRPQGEVLNETMYQLSMIKNEAERNAIAFKVFGKGASDLFPILNQGPEKIGAMAKEAERLGLVMSADAVGALDDFGDAMDKTKMAAMGFVNKGLAKVLPKLLPVLNMMADKAPAAGDAVCNALGGAGDAVKWLGENAQWLTPLIGGTVAAIMTFQAVSFAAGIIGALGVAAGTASIPTFLLTVATTALGGAFAFLTAPITLIALGIGAVVGVAILLYKNWDYVNERLQQGGNIIKNVFGGALTWVISKLNSFIDLLNVIPGVNIKKIALSDETGGSKSSPINTPKSTQKAVEASNKLDSIKKNALSDETSGSKGSPVNTPKSTQKAVQVSNRLDRYSFGGIANRPSIFGESGKEMAIPLNRTKRNLGLLDQAASMLGVKGSFNSGKPNINLVFHVQNGDMGEIERVVRRVMSDIFDDDGRSSFA